MNEYLDIISAYHDQRDKELAAVICAWLSNGWRDEVYVAKRILKDLGDHPATAIADYTYTPNAQATFFRGFSCHTYRRFIQRCRDVFAFSDTTLEDTVVEELSVNRYACYALAQILGGGTGYPTRNYNGTFYRYNLILYWLAYKLNVWTNIEPKAALLPCNQRVIEWAQKNGVLKCKAKMSLERVRDITLYAIQRYGQKDFYKLYEDIVA